MILIDVLKWAQGKGTINLARREDVKRRTPAVRGKTDKSEKGLKIHTSIERQPNLSQSKQINVCLIRL